MGWTTRVVSLLVLGGVWFNAITISSAFVGNKALNNELSKATGNRKAQHILYSETSATVEETKEVGNDESINSDVETQEPEARVEVDEEIVGEPVEEPVPELTTYRIMALLNGAIGYNKSAAAMFIAELGRARETGKLSRPEIDEMLNEVLYLGPDSKYIPFWARLLPLSRYSRRARLALLGKTLNKITPPASENSSSLDDVNKEEEENKAFAMEKRRRALVGLIRSLANADDDDTNALEPAIVALNRKVKEMGKQQNTEELRSRLPDGLETPDYDVIRESNPRGRLEIRRYKPFSVCSVSMTKPRPKESEATDAKVQLSEMKGSSPFGALAGYLFGKNEAKISMKMTTPVITTPDSQVEDKQMSFILPSEYWKDNEALEEAPAPLMGSGVTLTRRDSEERAVIMFGGYTSKKEVQRRKKQLMDSLEKDREWKASTDDIEVAQYNDPFTVPWRRLNEVSVRVVMK